MRSVNKQGRGGKDGRAEIQRRAGQNRQADKGAAAAAGG